jgi:multiple sugar transport system permease protein
MFNSALVATLATLISLVFNTLAGYAFAKLRFAVASGFSAGLLGALVIPSQVAMIPLFALVKELGLVSTYGGVIVPAMASVFGIFLIRSTRCRCRTSCSKPRASMARASCGSSGRWSCR